MSAGLAVAETVGAFVATYLEGWAEVDEADIPGSTRLEGDDADEVFLAFPARFGVDMDGFVDVFHHDPDEPPMGRFRVVSPDGAILPRIPVRVAMPVAAAREGRWHCPYPPHEVHKSPVLELAF